MSYVLKTKDGKYIVQPVTHPATDAQVYAAVKNYYDENGIPDILELETIKTDLYGEETGDGISLSWQVGQFDDSGNITSDAQSMRIVARFRTAVATTVKFGNTDKYKYTYVVCGLDGNVQTAETETSTWQSAYSLVLKKDRIVTIKVREKNYTVWTDEYIAAFAATLTVEYNPDIGVLEKLRQMDGIRETAESAAQKAAKNENSIEGIKSTLSGMDMQTNILLSYTDHFFRDIENGEINWEDGTDIHAGSTTFARSVGYREVKEEGCTFVADIPSTAKHSYYAYQLIDGEYLWQSVSDWIAPAATFRPESGLYYRVLVYDANGIAPDDVNIILCGDNVQNLLAGAASSSGSTSAGETLLDVSLDTDEQVELNTTIASLQEHRTPNTACIAFLTDLHIACLDTEEGIRNNSAKIQKMLSRYNRISAACSVDLLLFGGDYLNNNSTTNKETAELALATIADQMRMTRADVPRAVLYGNHDDNTMYTDYINGLVDENDFWYLLSGMDGSLTVRDTDRLQKAYGYYDIPNKKIRAIYLNTVDVPQVLDEESNTLNYRKQWDTGFSQAQLQFVADHLVFAESGWHVIIFSHHPLDSSKLTFDYGSSEACGVTDSHGGASMIQILNAYKNKTSGTAVCETKDFESVVSYDYTENESNVLIACVNGHTHKSGINYFGDNIAGISTGAVAGSSYDGLISSGEYFLINRSERKLYFIQDGDELDYVIDY